MAELLVFAKNTIGDDVYKNAKLPKAGHVITVQANNWPWGTDELTSPVFRILKVPSVGVAVFQSLLSPEVPVAPMPGQDWWMLTNTLQSRGFRIDFSNVSIPAAALTYWRDDTRAAASFTIGPAAVAAIQAAITKNAPIPDPAVIG